MNNLAPIVLFAYNRYDHLKQTIESLKLNVFAEDSDLYIFIDGPKNIADEDKVNLVRNYCNSITGFNNVVIKTNSNNIGLASSIISGVSFILSEFESIIVLEDDLITDKYFLTFMNNALDFYRTSNRVFCVTGFNYPPTVFTLPAFYKHDVYLVYKASSWGWGTWKEKWSLADWEIENFEEFRKDKRKQHDFNRGGSNLSSMLINQMTKNIDSWAIKWNYCLFVNNALCLYPRRSLIHHIGWDGSGVHASITNKFDNILLNKPYFPVFIMHNMVNRIVQKRFRNIFKTRFISKIKNRLMRIIRFK